MLMVFVLMFVYFDFVDLLFILLFCYCASGWCLLIVEFLFRFSLMFAELLLWC